MLGFGPADREAITGLFGPLDDVSAGALLAQIVVQANLRNADDVIATWKRTGPKTQEKALRRRLAVLHAFYETVYGADDGK